MSEKKYSKVATGGTFDGIHAGHRRLLERSFELGAEVVIGLTSDAFARKEGKVIRRPYAEREAGLEAFIERRFPGRRYTIAKLDDYFGPGIASPDVRAIVVTRETAKRVSIANTLRGAKGYPPLEVVLVDYVLADDSRLISSTRIRKGEIDTEGRLLTRSRKT